MLPRGTYAQLCASVPVVLVRLSAREKTAIEMGSNIAAMRNNMATERHTTARVAPESSAALIPFSA